MSTPRTFRALLKSSRRVGAYQHLSFGATGIGDGVRPGHFASVAVGDPDSAMVTRRAFSIHRVNANANREVQTLDLIVAAHGRGSSWLVAQPVGSFVDIISPLGRPFPMPAEPVSCLLVAGGYGSAPMSFLATELRARGCEVDFVYGAATEAKLFGVLEAKRDARHFQVTTDDGTSGMRGRVTDAMPDIMRKSETEVVYACGPMPMLKAVAQLSASLGVVSQVAVEESMACGVGVCMTCVLPVIGDDGVTRMSRSCMDGPVFRGDRVRWDSLNEVPDDCLGAPQVGGH